MSYYVLGFIGIPIMKTGFLLTLPNGTFEVAEGCGGLRYLLAALYIGSLLTYIGNYSTKRRIALIITFASLALVANVIRVVTVVIAGYLTDMQHHLVHHHVNLGWVIFLLFIFPLIYFSSRYEDRKID